MPTEPGRGEHVRLIQTTDAAGVPAPAEAVYPVQHQGLRSIVETTLEMFGAYALSPTANAGVYAYVDPAGARGWLRLEQFAASDMGMADSLVRTAEISRSIGRADPSRNEELAIGTAVVNRTSNPYFQIALGVFCFALAAVCIVFALVGLTTTGAGSDVALVVLGVGLVAVGVGVGARGIRRRSWWVAARAEAARRGEALPDQLKVWN